MTTTVSRTTSTVSNATFQVSINGNERPLIPLDRPVYHWSKQTATALPRQDSGPQQDYGSNVALMPDPGTTQ
jgi:hypothetical protein